MIQHTAVQTRLLRAGIRAATALLTSLAAVSAMAQSALPTGPDVIKSLYEVDATADTYPVTNGATAHYWYGREFELNGKRHFTGFLWTTRERYGRPGEAAARPEDQVYINAVTYTLDSNAWQPVGQNWAVGQFGAYDQGLAVDTGRQPVDFKTKTGKYLLAIPTIRSIQGFELRAWSVFLFTPKALAGGSDNAGWKLAGTFEGGEDNAAACAKGGMPCISNTASLSFEATDDVPRVVMTAKGSTLTHDNKARELGPRDQTRFSFYARDQHYVGAR